MRGATQTLKTVSLIDIEVEFNELYEGQPLFCDVDRFLRDHGFVLWRMSNLAFYSNGLVEGSNSRILIASDPGSFQTIDQDNGQLFWAQAHYVRREFAPTEPDAELDRERALKAAILVGQYGHWDSSLEILRKSGDLKLLNVLASVIRPCGPQVPLRDQLTAAHAEIAELRRQNAELRSAHNEELPRELHDRVETIVERALSERVEAVIDRMLPNKYSQFYRPNNVVAGSVTGEYMAASNALTRDFLHHAYQEFCQVYNISVGLHRKPWEWAFIYEHLRKRGVLSSWNARAGFWSRQ